MIIFRGVVGELGPPQHSATPRDTLLPAVQRRFRISMQVG